MVDYPSPTDRPSSGVGYSATPTPPVPIASLKTAPLPPPHLAGRGIDPADLDFSIFGNGDVGGTSQGPSGPAPSTPVQGNPFFNFLSSLFSRSGGGAPQGMTGLLNPPARSPRGVDTLGNPVGRF